MSQGISRKCAPFTYEYIRSVIEYDPDTGGWTWLVKGPGRKIDKDAAGCRRRTHNCITIDKHQIQSARAAWFWMTSDWPGPGYDVDHKNRDGHDDRWENIRLATRSQNMVNRKLRKRSDLPPGIYNNRFKYEVRVGIGGKERYVGIYETVELAKQAYLEVSRSIGREEFVV